MVNNSSSRCYQKKKKEGYKTKLVKGMNIFLKKKKKKKQQYARKRYKNPPKHEKQRLVE